MSFDEWVLFLGVLLLAMVFVGTPLSRLPLTGAMVYLVLGWLLGPDALGVMRPDPLRHAGELERLAEVALLISLFAVGLRLGVPLRDRCWRLPLRLAFLSLVAMVALVAGIGILVLGLSPGVAVLLGAILAPTDAVLASGVQSEPGADPDRLGFSLAGEGACLYIHGGRVPASMSEHQALTQPVEVLLEDPTLPVALAEPRTNLFKQTAYRPQMINTTPRVYLRQPIRGCRTFHRFWCASCRFHVA